ncbi:MAG: hypothetical protein ACXQTQ_02975 [Candidatus Hecatellaceae archaeon]
MLQTAAGDSLRENSEDEVHFCPIRRSTCIRRLCAWWIEYSRSCAIKVLAVKMTPKAEKEAEK